MVISGRLAQLQLGALVIDRWESKCAPPGFANVNVANVDLTLNVLLRWFPWQAGLSRTQHDWLQRSITSVLVTEEKQAGDLLLMTCIC
jgi:hypothetical protein